MKEQVNDSVVEYSPDEKPISVLQQALIASETRYRRLFETAKDGILILDADSGKIVDVNPFLIDLLGYSEEQFSGKEIWEIGLFKDIAANKEKFLELQQEEFVRYEDLPLETAEGKKINVEFVSNVYSAGGEKVIQCNIRDITARKLVEETLHENNLRLELVMKAANMAWWNMDIKTGNVTFEKFEEMLGYPPEKFIHNTDFTALLHPDDYDKAMDAIRMHCSGEISKYEVEYRIKASSGKYLWFYDIGSIVKKDADGKPLKVAGIVINITERKQAEMLLKESEIRFKNLFEKHNAIMLLIEPESGSIIDANNAAAAFYGYSISCLKTMTIYDINVLPAGQINIERKKAVYAKKNFFIFPHKIASGEIRNVEVHSSPIDFQGREILFSIIHDVTDRTAAEAVIKLKTEELQMTNAEKDKFFSIVAHDLRSPFNGFLGLTQIMAEQLNDLSLNDISKIATNMKLSATNLFSLLENLLEWSCLQRGITDFNPIPIKLLPKINESLLSVMESANKKRISVTIAVPESFVVYADGNMIASTIRNLVSNAVKFTPIGGSVSISAKSSNGNLVEISICDNGIGMSSDILENLFRIGASTNRKGTEDEPSTGLGLVLCKDFIEKLGGKLAVESQEDKGSTFRFTIPVQK